MLLGKLLRWGVVAFGTVALDGLPVEDLNSMSAVVVIRDLGSNSRYKQEEWPMAECHHSRNQVQ